MSDPLIGLRVQIIISEDGAPNPPVLPAGTITEKGSVHAHKGSQIVQYIVHLDKPVRYFRPPLNALRGPPIPRDWILSDLSIQSRYEGYPLDSLAEDPAPPFDVVTVMITNHSTGDYFAIGTVRRA